MNSPANLSTQLGTEMPDGSDFQLLFDLCPAALLVIQPNLRVCFGNRAAEQFCNGIRQESANRTLAEWVVPAEREALLRFVAQAQREGVATSSRQQFRFFTEVGATRTIELHAGNLPAAGNRKQLVLACHDVSSQQEKLEQTAEMAYVDSLTGLSNLRRFEEALDREMRLSRRTGRPFSILMLDLDHLKQINDSAGHLAGNRAICRVAQVLREQCRATDIAGRFGGDEFYLILPEANITEALFCADRIRKVLALDHESPTLSVSIGAASFPQDGQTMESLTEAADAELYQAKRNRKPLAGSQERKAKVSRVHCLTVGPTETLPVAV